MIIDLHSHTCEHSPCSHQTAEELILQAVEVGLDGIVLTDHDYHWSRGELDEVLTKLGNIPLVVLRGQEVSCVDGHLLVYGMEERVRGDGPRLAVAEQVRSQGGATIFPHPFRWEGYVRESNLEVAQLFREFDAVEGWTTNHGDRETDRARGFRDFPGVRLVGASDAHSVDRVGRYATRLKRPARTERDLVEILRIGAVSPVARGAEGEYVPCP